MSQTALRGIPVGEINAEPRADCADNGIQQEILEAYQFNITWYERAAHLQRAIHYIVGLGIILGQVATLSSFAFESQLSPNTSPMLAGVTSALIAVFGFLSPTAKWRDFRTAQHELMAQCIRFRIESEAAPDAHAKRDVQLKYIDLGMHVVTATAASHWRQVSRSADRLKAAASAEPQINHK